MLRPRSPLSADIGNASSSARGFASDIGAPSAENVDFVVIQTHLSPLVFDRTQNKQALHVDTAAGGGRSSATSRRMSANRFLGMATSAIWNAT